MKILSFLLILFTFLILANSIYALDCSGADKDKIECKFGTISPPPALQNFIGTDTTGATGISKFLSNLVVLIYSIAAIVLIFMLLWGAFEWLTSGGEKEHIAAAQKRIINAIIGILLFAAAFAVITVLGAFTGFKFFEGQGVRIINDRPGIKFQCPNGDYVGGGSDDPEIACKGHGR